MGQGPLITATARGYDAAPMFELRHKARRVFDRVQSVIPVNDLLHTPLPFAAFGGERVTFNDVLAQTLPGDSLLGRRVMLGDVMGKALPVLKQALRPGPSELLWLDRADAYEEAGRRSMDPFLVEHARNLIEHGVTRLEANVPADLCDRVVQQFHSFCDQHPAHANEYKDEQGYHSRLLNLHLTSEAALEVGLNPNVMRLLDFVFGYRAVAYTSLTFEKGSQQAMHQDAPFFRTHPEGFFFGVWTALEDVRPDAGPLTYVRGGHRIRSIDRREVLRTAGGHANAFHVWNKRVIEEADKWGLSRETAQMKKGDTLIWHPFLPHGGAPIQDKRLTRKSIVFHYLPQHIAVHPLESFIDPAFVDPSKHYRRLKRGGREYLAVDGPVFNHNY